MTEFKPGQLVYYKSPIPGHGKVGRYSNELPEDVVEAISEAEARELMPQVFEELDKARAYIRSMVEKAASNNLEGYRDMAGQMARKDEEIDALREENERLCNSMNKASSEIVGIIKQTKNG